MQQPVAQQSQQEAAQPALSDDGYDDGSESSPRERADMAREDHPAPPPQPQPQPAQASEPMQKPEQLLELLERLEFGHMRKNGGKDKAGYTLGTTRGSPGRSGFDKDGFNYEIVPKYLPSGVQEVLKEFWKVLEAEGEALGYKFTSVQVNKNFAAEQRHRHPKDTNFQWCASLGQFEGGNLCWLEGNSPPFSVSTRGVWHKMDGRHTHWVEPYRGDRYSLVLFCNTGEARPLFYSGSSGGKRGNGSPSPKGPPGSGGGSFASHSSRQTEITASQNLRHSSRSRRHSSRSSLRRSRQRSSRQRCSRSR